MRSWLRKTILINPISPGVKFENKLSLGLETVSS